MYYLAPPKGGIILRIGTLKCSLTGVKGTINCHDSLRI